MPNKKVYRCQYCETRFVIMITERHELLPVEIGEEQVIDEDEIYSKEKHVSHLLNCIPRRMDWNQVRKKYEKKLY